MLAAVLAGAAAAQSGPPAGAWRARDVPPGGLTVCRAKDMKTYPDWKRPQKKK